MSTNTGKSGSQPFIDHQKAIDNGINERIKKEKGKDKLDPSEANNAKNRDRQSNAGQKKTGAGKQKNPGM